jgi:hypothetical protein
MKQPFKLLTLASLIALYSCGSNTRSAVSMDAMESFAAEPTPAPDKSVPTPTERKLIKEGDIRFRTKDVKETKALIVKAVQELGAYISKDNANDYPDRIEHSMVIRVAADKFDLLLDKISKSTEELETKNIDILDVTEEYIDVESRVKTKKELEIRYRELLKKATKVDEILNIEREIGTLRADIESIEGRLNFLKDQVSFSTLKVTYYQKNKTSFGFSSKFGQGIKNGWNNLMVFIIGLVSLWPFMVLGAAVFYFVIRYEKRRKRNKKAA